MSEPAAVATRGRGGSGSELSSGLTRSPLTWVVLGLLAVVRRLLWLIRVATVRQRPHCRFHPTCSEYAVQAVRTHGGVRGSMYALRRLTRCHPWNDGGVDPIPTRE